MNKRNWKSQRGFRKEQWEDGKETMKGHEQIRHSARSSDRKKKERTQKGRCESRKK